MWRRVPREAHCAEGEADLRLCGVANECLAEARLVEREAGESSCPRAAGGSLFKRASREPGSRQRSLKNVPFAADGVRPGQRFLLWSRALSPRKRFGRRGGVIGLVQGGEAFLSPSGELATSLEEAKGFEGLATERLDLGARRTDNRNRSPR